jgi:hypothetical protein
MAFSQAGKANHEKTDDRNKASLFTQIVLQYPRNQKWGWWNKNACAFLWNQGEQRRKTEMRRPTTWILFLYALPLIIYGNRSTHLTGWGT